MFYSIVHAVGMLGVAVVLGLGLANGGEGGTPYWPVVITGVVMGAALLVAGATARRTR